MVTFYDNVMYGPNGYFLMMDQMVTFYDNVWTKWLLSMYGPNGYFL